MNDKIFLPSFLLFTLRLHSSSTNMFDFERFPVYIKSEELYSFIVKNIFSKPINKNLKDQLQRASTSITLNIAEGAGKYSKADKKNYYLTAR